MAVFLEVQVETMLHRFVMKDRDAAEVLISKLAPYVGVPVFRRNDDGPRQIEFETDDGKAVLSLDRLHAVRVTDHLVFDAADEERRKKLYQEMRAIDIELLHNLR